MGILFLYAEEQNCAAKWMIFLKDMKISSWRGDLHPAFRYIPGWDEFIPGWDENISG
jgi:hypothetical protein